MYSYKDVTCGGGYITLRQIIMEPGYILYITWVIYLKLLFCYSQMPIIQAKQETAGVTDKLIDTFGFVVS